MSRNPPINLDKLEKELVSALEADRRYSRENDAKFRAVNQKVATYEEFRDIVKASHLSSLDRDDITGRKGRKQPWNPIASLHSPDLTVDEGSNHHGNNNLCGTSILPKDAQEFLREWRRLRLSPTDQYQFLHRIGANHLHSLFKIEISMGLLGELLEVLNLCYLDADREDVVEILQELSRSSRFELSLRFLGKSEKKAAKELFDKLIGDKEDASTDQKEAHDLAKLYMSE